MGCHADDKQACQHVINDIIIYLPKFENLERETTMMFFNIKDYENF